MMYTPIAYLSPFKFTYQSSPISLLSQFLVNFLEKICSIRIIGCQIYDFLFESLQLFFPIAYLE